MDFETVYIRTAKGEENLGDELLSLEIHDILSRVDGKSGVRQLMQDAAFWSEETFAAALNELLELEWIQAVPGKTAEASIAEAPVGEEDVRLDESVSASVGKSKFAQSKRTLIASVLFLDIVEYTKRSVADQLRFKDDFNRLVSELIQGIPEGDRIIIDTGDGAALGFLADPEQVLFIAIRLRDALEANGHRNYPGLYVRMGINLGPVKLVADMNGRENLIGDGVNDANRVMNFASGDQILVSRSFYDVVSRLSSEHYGLFKYQGIHKDKHRREHEIYEVAGGDKTPVEEKVEEKSEEEIRAERLDKMKARLEAAAKAEAESRAAMAAQEKARVAAGAEMRKQAEARLVERSRSAGLAKKRSNTGKIVLIALAVVIVLVVALLPFIPLVFIAKKEAADIADKTQETVTVGTGYFSLLPTPRIELDQVTIGQDLKIAKMTEILSLSGSNALAGIVADGVSANQNVLDSITGWGGQPLAATISLKNVSLSLNGEVLPVFGVEIDLSDDGTFQRAQVTSGGMQTGIQPAGTGYQIELSAKNWKLPLLSDCPWDEVHARAVVTGKELKVTSMSGSGYGGNWSGSARVSWNSGWRVEASLAGRDLDAEPIMPFFSTDAKLKGTIQFDATFASSAASFEKLFDLARIRASFNMKNGAIGNLDIAQAIRASSSDGARGGETKFDDFSGTFSRANSVYRLEQFRLNSGILRAQGGAEVRGGTLSGRIEVDLNQMHSPLTLGGTLLDPVVR